MVPLLSQGMNIHFLKQKTSACMEFSFPNEKCLAEAVFLSISQCQARGQQETSMNKKCWNCQCLNYETLDQSQY